MMKKLPPLTIKNHTLNWGQRTYLMGILNITPDSFSGDGLLAGRLGKRNSLAGTHSNDELIEASLAQARHFVSCGADILDVGGESTRPGAQSISLEEELVRVIPVIQAITNELDTLISVDTYKSEVAQVALQAGANIVNDVWAFRADPNLASVAAKYKAPVILMHNRSSAVNAEVRERLGGRYINVPYVNLIEDIKVELLESVKIAQQVGIPDERIILDPGIGFGKTVEQNLELLNHLDELLCLDYPLLVGPSRKSFIGYTLDLPPDKRLEGTAAAVVVSIIRGANIIRVHDVEFMARLCRMTDAILRDSGNNPA